MTAMGMFRLFEFITTQKASLGRPEEAPAEPKSRGPISSRGRKSSLAALAVQSTPRQSMRDATAALHYETQPAPTRLLIISQCVVVSAALVSHTQAPTFVLRAAECMNTNTVTLQVFQPHPPPHPTFLSFQQRNTKVHRRQEFKATSWCS